MRLVDGQFRYADELDDSDFEELEEEIRKNPEKSIFGYQRDAINLAVSLES